MKRIVLTGANGYLANVIRLYNEDKYEFIRITRNEIDFSKDLFLVLDNIEDPGNMGTLIRTALAFSYDLVIASKNSVSIYNSKTINASKGAIFMIDAIHDDIDKYLPNHKLIVSTLQKDSISLEEVDINDNFILVVGSESHGVSREIIKKADVKVKIDIDNIDSLNAAVAGAILMNKIR